MRIKLTTLLILCLVIAKIEAQQTGYFGKQNYFGLHGSWFLRAMPQVFFEETIYHYSNRNEEFVNGFFRNHIGNLGLSYKRLINNRTAIGLQYDFGNRNLGSPIFDFNRWKTFDSPWQNEFAQNIAWSNSENRFLDMKDLEINRTQIRNQSFHLTYSRCKTASVFPLGLMSTFGLGIQYSSLNYKRPMYARAFTKEALTDVWSEEMSLTKLTAPQNFENAYLGISWIWDLSINYAINNKLLFSISSELRGVPFVFQLTNTENIKSAFPFGTNQIPSIEAAVYGRNLSREIRKEMFIQNTLRFGLTFAF